MSAQSAPSEAALDPPAAGSLQPIGLSRSEHRAILQACDAVFALGGAAATWTRWGQVGVWLGAAALLWVLLAPSRRLGIVASPSASLRWLAWAALVVAGVVALLHAGLGWPEPSGEALARFLASAGGATLLGRLLHRGVLLRPRFQRRAVVLGTGESARRVLEAMRRAAHDTQVLAFVDLRETRSVTEIDGLPVAAGREGLARLIAAERIGEIIVAGHASVDDRLLQALLKWQEAGVELVRSRTVHEHLLGRIPLDEVEADWLLSSFADTIRLRDDSDIARRALDVLGGIAGCLLLLVVSPFVALAIWLDDGRPVLFRQLRTGRAGSPFALLKFRTMRRDAEASGPRWAETDDARVTRVGRLLRRARIDELPQFLNVLAGQMSLVGPRPERPEFVATLEEAIPFYRVRLIVRPGLTGWAQVNRPYGSSVEDARAKLEFDLFYIRHRSIWFDLRVLLKTLLTVARLGGR